MRKCEKNRLKRIHLHQKLAKAKRQVHNAYGNQADGRPDSALDNDSQIINNIVMSLSTKVLHTVIDNPTYFTGRFPRFAEFHSRAEVELVDRAIKLSQ